MRPSTLREAYERINAGPLTNKPVFEFLDSFYADRSRAGRAARLAEEPARTGDPRLDAFAAAAASYLAKISGIEPPDWCGARDRVLNEPWFMVETDSPAFREFLAWASPAEFRARNIFTEERPLRRKNSHLMPTE